MLKKYVAESCDEAFVHIFQREHAIMHTMNAGTGTKAYLIVEMYINSSKD